MYSWVGIYKTLKRNEATKKQKKKLNEVRFVTYTFSYTNISYQNSTSEIYLI